MGTAYQRNGKGTWYIKIKGVDGKWKPYPTDCPDEKAAKALAKHLEAENEKKRNGMIPMSSPAECKLTLGELCNWWLAEHCSPNSLDREKSRLTRHIINYPIGKLRLPEATAAVLQKHWRALEEAGLGPESLNRLRTDVICAFREAIEVKMWTGESPAAKVKKREPIDVEIRTLLYEEVPIFLANVPGNWRGPCAQALWTALRKGEVCGLKKTDIDLPARKFRVARSYDKPRPKGKRAVILPIPEPLVPFIEEAMASSKSEWLYPGPDGQMRTEDCDPEKIVRTALKRAGIVDGWDHVCRRCKAQEKEVHTYRYLDAVRRECPTCGMKLWPRAIPRHMDFHSLRHTVGTLLSRAGVDPHHIQKIMRHASITTTFKTYVHLEPEDLRSALQALPTLPRDFGALVVQADRGDSGPPTSGAEIAKQNVELGLAGKEIRTPDPRLGNPSAGVTREYQRFTSVRNVSAFPKSAVQEIQSVAPNQQLFGALVVQPESPRLRALASAIGGLLSVREVAAHLRLSEATVYKLCNSNELVSTRVSNAIRVNPSDLAAFIERGKRRP